MVDAPHISEPPAQPSVPAAAPRRVVLVAGPERSGTSAMAGALQALGMGVPAPEVAADETRPKRLAQSQWVLDLHDELLERTNVAMDDARPSAWFDTGRLNNFEPLRTRVHDWLEEQLVAGGPELVLKDPRLAWFLGQWRSAAMRCQAEVGHAVLLRPVTEVVGSRQRAHDARTSEVHRTAAWVNLMLHLERSTRGQARAFVRYHDLLDDWTVPVFGLGQRFDLDAVKAASANDIRRVHQFIDPSLRRAALTWADVDVPTRLRDLAQATWEALDRLPEDGGDTPEVHATLDGLRAAYADMYDEAQALTGSTTDAARREGARAAAAAPSAVERVPHSVRAMVPPSVRRGLRKVAGRERG
ncbi:hypothetical protein I601_1139 [Nocardioides dokdonensis FR1436]|uniref:Sulfotransferase family protein n=1 Tax=Nocardioides dokdonensis FR1436 TaxID=1300347 RepID=A0A1A9GJA4_9ACTN|nr:sulfotransferase family protein [Nocardioides dokdonensis]ANH37581.1 hypothetical protein I601_1139 [Nocardioides dokdonensis FR1436]